MRGRKKKERGAFGAEFETEFEALPQMRRSTHFLGRGEKKEAVGCTVDCGQPVVQPVDSRYLAKRGKKHIHIGRRIERVSNGVRKHSFHSIIGAYSRKDFKVLRLRT